MSQPTVEELRGLSVFGMLEDEELATLCGVLQVRRFDARQVIFEEGKAAREVYFLAQGEVAISKRLGRTRRTLSKLEKNSIFGHMPLIDRGMHEATATATTDVKAYCLERDMFARLAGSAAPMALKLMVPLVTACCRAARCADDLVHGLYADPQATLLTLHTS